MRQKLGFELKDNENYQKKMYILSSVFLSLNECNSLKPEITKLYRLKKGGEIDVFPIDTIMKYFLPSIFHRFDLLFFVFH